MPDVTFNGPAGRIEGKYYPATKPNAPIALVMHPHPQHGGTMNNKVTYRMYEAFVKAGFATLRFNFRGVGNSQGQWDEGVGELSDAAAALDWLHNQNSHCQSIWIAGFSFGSWITMQLLMRRPDVNRFIAVAPPVGKYDFSFFSPCPTSGLFITGTQDELFDYKDLKKFIQKTPRQKGVKLHYSEIQDGDHFFTEQQDELAKVLSGYIKSSLTSSPSSAA